MGEVSTIGLDIAKSVFQIHGVDRDGEVAIRKRVSRAKLLELFAGLPPCVIGIEACPTAHHWSRKLQTLGHTVRLMPPSYVKAYLKRSKNDANDAAAICEAVTRPSMRFVPIKSEQQQSGLMLHRSRQLLVRQRTMLSNAIRGHMAELGIISAKGRNGTAELLKIIATENDDCIPAAARFSLDVLARQYVAIAAEIGVIEKRIHAWHRSCDRKPAARGDPRHWPDRRHSSGGGSRRLESLLVRPQPGGLDWPCSQAAFDRRQGAAWRDFKTGQPIFAMAARCGRNGCHPIRASARH